jgi:tRNA pseudouridine55 synthase
MHSAIKFQGQPLYKLARQGKSIDRKVRQVNILQLQLHHVETTTHQVTFSVVCSKGTYVRTLVEDMGEALGCGATVIGLHREYVMPFNAAKQVTLDDLKAIDLAQRRDLLLPVEKMLSLFFPLIEVSQADSGYLRRGMEIDAPNVTHGWVTLVTQMGDFLGLGEILHTGRLAPRRLVEQTL